MSLYTKHIPTTIFAIPLLFLVYEPLKVYKNNMDNPVKCPAWETLFCKIKMHQSVILEHIDNSGRNYILISRGKISLIDEIKNLSTKGRVQNRQNPVYVVYGRYIRRFISKLHMYIRDRS